MFIVYSGYVGPDSYDASESPCYSLDVYDTEVSVIAAYKEHQEVLESDDWSNGIFRVFLCDRELFLESKEVVTAWSLRSGGKR